MNTKNLILCLFCVLWLLLASCVSLAQIQRTEPYSHVPSSDPAILSEVLDVCKSISMQDANTQSLVGKMNNAAGMSRHISAVSYLLFDSKESIDERYRMREERISRKYTREQLETGHLHDRRILPYFEGWATRKSHATNFYAPNKQEGSISFDVAWSGHINNTVVISRITLDSTSLLPSEIVRITSSCMFPKSQQRYVRRYKNYQPIDGVQIPTQVYVRDSFKAPELLTLKNTTIEVANAN